MKRLFFLLLPLMALLSVTTARDVQAQCAKCEESAEHTWCQWGPLVGPDAWNNCTDNPEHTQCVEKGGFCGSASLGDIEPSIFGSPVTRGVLGRALADGRLVVESCRGVIVGFQYPKRAESEFRSSTDVILI